MLQVQVPHLWRKPHLSQSSEDQVLRSPLFAQHAGLTNEIAEELDRIVKAPIHFGQNYFFHSCQRPQCRTL